MKEGKMIRARQMNVLIMIAIIVGICIPLFFTAVQTGVFAKEPVVEARQEVRMPRYSEWRLMMGFAQCHFMMRTGIYPVLMWS